ncbi:hypothetical protein DRP43_04155 [candidate division TA06 bacterium]|uniref:DUF5320 domain-containing protein n=1 Tax=candidate division TA06 bacterium TaxID=2250710 RepID=A0A660SI02_UNCT6|nr:MAG: hypothetical protein DRP43_04155 [candidate division TA06 bacterium]
MPYGDRTGPEGFGPRTGRGMGYCSGYNQPGYASGGYGRGRGFGRGGGFGRGFGRWFGRSVGRWFGAREPGFNYPSYDYPEQSRNPVTAEDEKTYLENEMNMLKKEMDAIDKRLKELSTKKK